MCLVCCVTYLVLCMLVYFYTLVLFYFVALVAYVAYSLKHYISRLRSTAFAKLTGLETIFFTYKSWENTGGLMGMHWFAIINFYLVSPDILRAKIVIIATTLFQYVCFLIKIKIISKEFKYNRH